MLSIGSIVRLAPSGQALRVEALLGEGGQGTVYSATPVDGSGPPMALKWYFPSKATPSQHAMITNVVDAGAPDDRFLWPESMAVSDDDRTTFGYVMAIRDPSYMSMAAFMRGAADTTFANLARVGFELADSFLNLHSQGMCYRDISFGNLFIDPADGAVLICDNDNVSTTGSTDAQVVGTPYFMAPEILRREAPPSADTDLYSLAVLLFYLLILHHPLEGNQTLQSGSWDAEALIEHFGTRPCFIFDPANETNRPDPGEHANALAFWPIYPQFVRDLFTQSFTQGLTDPKNGRVRESVWRRAMLRLADSVVLCPACGAEAFFGGARTCWRCGSALWYPPRIDVAGNTVMLNASTTLTRHHLRNDLRTDEVVAEVTQHPEDPNRWGLRNLGLVPWQVCSGDTRSEIVPGRAVALTPDLEIDFGGPTGVIRRTED